MSWFYFKVQGSRFKVQGSRFKVQGSRFKVQSSKFKIQGLMSSCLVLPEKIKGTAKRFILKVSFTFVATNPIGATLNLEL